MIAINLLAACSGTISNPCPELIPYDPPIEDDAARELALLPNPSVIAQMIIDYQQLRDEVRACRGREG